MVLTAGWTQQKIGLVSSIQDSRYIETKAPREKETGWGWGRGTERMECKG